MVLTTLSKKHKSKSRKGRKRVSRRKINKKTKKQRNIRRKLSKKNKRGGGDKRELYASNKTLHLVCGLAGDFCVLDTALNIKTLYPNTNVRFLTYFTRFVISKKPTELPQDVETKLKEAKIDYIQSDDSEICLTPESAGEIAFGKSNVQYDHIVLWVIDMQNDFIERTFGDREDEGAFEKGTFAVQGTSEEQGQGCRLVEDISELIKYISEMPNTEIVVSRDYHPEGHCSFQSKGNPSGFPPHCVEKTVGAQMNETILRTFENIPEDKYSVIFKGCEPNTDSYGAVIYSDKTYLEGRSPSCIAETDKTGGRNNPNMSPKEALIFNGEIDKVFVIPITTKTVAERIREIEK